MAPGDGSDKHIKYELCLVRRLSVCCSDGYAGTATPHQSLFRQPIVQKNGSAGSRRSKFFGLRRDKRLAEQTRTVLLHSQFFTGHFTVRANNHMTRPSPKHSFPEQYRLELTRRWQGSMELVSDPTFCLCLKTPQPLVAGADWIGMSAAPD